MKYFFLLFSTLIFGQQTQFVDFKSVQAQLHLFPKEKSVSGFVKYDFEVLKSIDTIKIDAQNMRFSEVKLNDNSIPFETNGKQLLLMYPFKKGKNQLQFQYKATPKQTLYFLGSEAQQDFQIWTQGQGKYTSHWFPSFDDVNEKVVFNLSITFDKKYEVISNGKLKKSLVNKELKEWNFQMKKPMSSYLLMLAIGNFEKRKQISSSGIPLELYFEPQDSSKFEPTYRYSKEIFDFLETEIGVKYPWKIYRQIPIRDFLYAGMENTTSTLFANQFVVDSTGFENQNYVNTNAHELAHQWFGDLVTAKSGEHHWLQEGFATYFALLAEGKVFGEDYFYNKLYDYSQTIYKASKTDTIPILSSKASSLTYYQKGALALHVLRAEIGEKIFQKAVKRYLKKHAFQNVTTDDFLSEIEKVSQYDVANFKKVWLENGSYNTLIINNLVKKNKSIQLIFELEKLKSKSLETKFSFFQEILKSEAYWSVKKAVVFQLRNEKFKDTKPLFELALASNSIQLRQVVAMILTEIPEEFRVNYETLLDDKSYETKEAALFNLWKNFPEHRVRYLEKSKFWMGFNDYSLRISWLVLAISTSNFQYDKDQLKNELINYSSNKFEARTRQIAIENLEYLKLINPTVLKNVANLTTHHAWFFSKFGRDKIQEWVKNPDLKLELESVLPNLNEKEQFQLERLLKK